MVLTPQKPSKHNSMITQFIKHPKSTNFDGNKDRPAKRQNTDSSPKKQPLTPRKSRKLEVPDFDADNTDHENEEEKADHKTDLESALPPVKSGEEAIQEYEAFKASQEENAAAAGEPLEKRAWVRGKSSLYVDAFNLALDTVLEEESHLFDEAEREVFRVWRALDYEAQYL